jgi:hypothetical protein
VLAFTGGDADCRDVRFVRQLGVALAFLRLFPFAFASDFARAADAMFVSPGVKPAVCR